MRARNIRLAAVSIALLGTLGCGSGGQPAASAEEQAEPAPPSTRLSDWLTRPRSELAKRADELVNEIRAREKARAAGEVKFSLIPDFRQPPAIPVFQEARFDAKLGLSLPPYFDPASGAAKAQLAEHVQAFGDHWAADVLSGRKPDPAAKSFPIEWTRMVALETYNLQQRLASGDADCLEKFIDLHTQVGEALGEAGKGLLGQTLLPRGRHTLEQAAQAWRKQGQVPLAERAEAAARNWGKTDWFPLRADFQRWQLLTFAGKQPDGRVIALDDPAAVLDLAQLPFPRDAAQGGLAFFSADGKLEAVVVTYTPRTSQMLDAALQLAEQMGDYRAAEPGATASSCVHRGHGWTVETGLCPAGGPLGGWVRAARDGLACAPPRKLGPVDLDHGFDTNRLPLAPAELGDNVLIDPDDQASVNPLPEGELKDLNLIRVPGMDLLGEARFRFSSGKPVHRLAFPLFARQGPGAWRYVAESGARPGRVEIVWTSGPTTMTFAVPQHAKEACQLMLTDSRTGPAAKEWSAAVAAQEQVERLARLEAGQPQRRLPRKLEHLPLGLARAEALRFLPQGQSVRKHEIDGGMIATVLSTPPPNSLQGQAYLVRQVIVRFDAKDRVASVQARYESIQTSNRVDWPALLLQQWETQVGSVAGRSSPWASRLQDLPPQTPPAQVYRWRDDLTEAEFQLDRNGVSICLRDRPRDDRPAPPLEYLPRGPDNLIPGLQVGTSRSQLAAALGGSPTVTPDGSWAIRPERGAYDAILVTFDGEQVRRITARHRLDGAPQLAHSDLEKTLLKHWGTQIGTLGWPQRRDWSNQGAVQCLTWLDDATRIRLYWAESDDSPPRLWTEWRDDASR